MFTKYAITTLALSTLLAAPAAAQTPQWSVMFETGSDLPLSGDVHGGGSGSVLSLPTTVQARNYDDIYGKPFTWALNVGAMATESGEVRVRLHRTRADASTVQVGNVATLPLFATFDTYTALGMDVGYRQYIETATDRVMPYVGGSVGFVNVDEITSTFSVPAAGVVLPDVPMYDSSLVPAFAVSGGALFPVTEEFAVQAGVDFRWMNNLDPVDGLAGTGLESINDETRRWSMPITIGAVVRF